MSEHTGLIFWACLKAPSMTSADFVELLRRLWERGIDYSQPPTQAQTWEAERDRSHCEAIAGTALVSGPLGKCVDRIIQEQGGLLTLVAGDFLMDLTVHAKPWSASPDAPPIWWLSLSIQRGAIDPTSADADEAERGGYRRARVAFLQWCSVLCVLTQPLFGFGYDPRTDVQDERALFAYMGETTGKELLAGRLPDVRIGLKADPFKYIPSIMVRPSLLESVIDRAGYAVKRLSDGGLFVVPPAYPSTAEASLAYAHVARGKEQQQMIRNAFLDQSQRKGSKHDRAALHVALERARNEYQRALMIFRSIESSQGEEVVQQALNALHPLSERLLGNG